MSVLGDRLREQRIKHGYRQTDVVDRLNLGHPIVLSRYETGLRVPDAETIARLATYYGVMVDYLLGRTNSPTEAVPSEDDKLLLRATGKLSPADRDKVLAFVRFLDAQVDAELDGKTPTKK